MAATQLNRSSTAWPGLLVVAGSVTLLLLLMAGRYGYHRDELYFLRAGSEPAFGYADQPPLTPLLAHALDVVFQGSLVGLRAPSAVMGGLIVLLTGLIAREFGAPRGAQVLAAACMAVGAATYAITHLLSTSTLDLLVWTALSWLLVRALPAGSGGTILPAGSGGTILPAGSGGTILPAGSGGTILRDGGPGWLAVGVVAGIGLQNKTLVAFLLAAVLIGVLAAGPRTALRSPWPWAAVLVALAIWTPNLVWQALNGWPVLELSRSIASGGSGTSEPWYLFVPFQLLLVSPLLVPVWAVGWWHLARRPELRTWRAFAVAYVLLAVVFVLTGGKPYYLYGLYPVLLAAGAAPTWEWARRTATRTGVLATALVVSLGVSAVLFLPVLPSRWLPGTPVPAINYDAGETVGWPALAATVHDVRDELPAHDRVAVLARNYGQAGAVDRFLPDLAPAHSGHFAYWTWGPPPADATTLIVLGYDEEDLRNWFDEVRLAARVDNGVGLNNDEQGTSVWLVSDLRVPWSELWPQLRRPG